MINEKRKSNLPTEWNMIVSEAVENNTQADHNDSPTFVVVLIADVRYLPVINHSTMRCINCRCWILPNTSSD